MAPLTLPLTLAGGILLAHAIYSSHEHSLLPPTTPATTLPLDIALETLLSTLLLTLAIITSSPALRPIRWNDWAGKIEREGWDPHALPNEVGVGGSRGDGSGKGKGGRGNPYAPLEERRGFWNVRSSRKAFADFIREGGDATKGAQ